MLPKPPPRETPPGFLYLPPYRVYGVSIAGESTCIQIPELDICFDMGECLRPSLAAKFVVRQAPGSTVFARTPKGASSSARDAVNPSTAILLAL